METSSESSSLESDCDESLKGLDDDQSEDLGGGDTEISRGHHSEPRTVKNLVDLTHDHKSVYKSKRFSSSVVTALNRYYNNGMCGVGKRYDCLISCAARETKLTVLQVKVCHYN